MSTEVLCLSADEVDRLLDIDTAIDSQRAAFASLARGTTSPAEKIMVPGGPDGSVAVCYAARLSTETGPVCKFVSVNPANARLGLPSISGVLMALDPETGRPVAIMDGAIVTAVRTAAASAAVADALATAQSTELAVLGSGVQGRGHVHAICRVRPIREVRMWSRSEERRHRVARELASELGLAVEPCASAEEAVRNADIVATCTLSLQPVLRGAWLSPGTTVLSVGSFEPHRHEIDAAVIERAAAVVIDDPATAARHAGPIVAAISEGRLGVDDLVSVGEVIVGRVRARTSSEDVIYYNSTGLGVQDAAACWAVIGRARAAGAGQTIAL